MFIPEAMAGEILRRKRERGQEPAVAVDDSIPETFKIDFRVPLDTGRLARFFVKTGLVLLGAYEPQVARTDLFDQARKVVCGEESPGLRVAGHFHGRPIFDSHYHGFSIHQVATGDVFLQAYFFGGAYGFAIVLGHSRPLNIQEIGRCVLHAVDGDGATLQGEVSLGDDFTLPPRHAWRGCEIFEALVGDVSLHDEVLRALQPRQSVTA
jgi:hypothetical protein